MKLFKNYFFPVLIALCAFTVSCNKDDEAPKGEFASGVLVVNEGAFNGGNGTIAHYDPAKGIVTQDIFGSKNDRKALGDVVQSLTIDGDVAYAVVNNSNKVEVVNSNTFVSEYTLNDVKLPRYFTTLSGKGYLTEWVSFTDKGRVSVVNLETHKVETTITTDYGAEGIIAVGSKLFVSNNFSNTVSVINPTENKVTATITVASSPGDFVLDKENKLWVICSDPYGTGKAFLYRINPSSNTVEKSFELKVGAATHLVTNQAKDQLFYMDSNSVYKVSIQSTTAPSTFLLRSTTAIYFYGLGVDPNTDIIYVADTPSFATNGIVYRYKSDGTAIDQFTAGIGTNGFVFR